MSFNRGFRNDSRTNSPYQANNQRPMQRLSNISPWEGGVVPNSRQTNSQSLLGLSTSSPQNNASALLSPQQLIIANTLLSSLGMNVQQQQQQQQQQERISQQLQYQAQLRNNNLTPLLRMDRSQMDFMGNGQPLFRQNNQNNYKFNNVPTDRFRGMDAMRSRVHQNMTSNRNEPYTKNRLQQSASQQQQHQRRTFVNKPRVERKPAAIPNKQGTTAVPEATGQKPKFQKTVTLADSSNSAPMEQEVESKPGDDPANDDQIIPCDGDLATSTIRDDEEVVAKRDWKNEKNVDSIEMAIAHPPHVAEKGELDDSAVIDTEEPIKKDTEDTKEKGIGFLCHICNIDVGDEKLLQEHRKLESHKTMMEKTSESYLAQAAALRLNMQEVYGRIDAKNRNNRHDQQREFCKMCKLNFVGTIASHRKLKEHLQLKAFLHPRCLSCSKEFTTRIEWDEHKLSAAHQIQEQAVVAKAAAKAAAAVADGSDKKPEAERKGYQPRKTYGYNYISEGFYCRVCKMFFDKRALSRAHLQSKPHYDMCIAFETNEKEKESKVDTKILEPDAEPSAEPGAKPVADDAPGEDESATKADDTAVESSATEADINAESGAEGSESKRQKLSEDVKDETINTASVPETVSWSIPKIESDSLANEDEILAVSTESENLEEENEPGIESFLLDNDINMILDESGLDLGFSESVGVKDEETKQPIQKARRGGRALRGRKRK